MKILISVISDGLFFVQNSGDHGSRTHRDVEAEMVAQVGPLSSVPTDRSTANHVLGHPELLLHPYRGYCRVGYSVLRRDIT